MKTEMKSRNARCGLLLGLRSLAAGIISASRQCCLLVCALCWVPLACLHAAVPTYQLLKSLDSTSGTNPYARLIQGTDGALYGTKYSQGGLGDGTVLLRAERAGKGDGRVYRIAFTASDPEGSVSGVVFVKVPNTLKKPAIDSGWVFDSTL